MNKLCFLHISLVLNGYNFKQNKHSSETHKGASTSGERRASCAVATQEEKMQQRQIASGSRATRKLCIRRTFARCGCTLRLLLLLGLLIGVLYSIHLLVKDYQALTAPRLLRLLFKRDVSSQNYSKPNVRWRKILLYDPIQCGRLLYCDIGARPPDNEIRQGFTFMLTLEPRDEDKTSQEVFKQAYDRGRDYGEESCTAQYPLCPFKGSHLFELVQYLLRQH